MTRFTPVRVALLLISAAPFLAGCGGGDQPAGGNSGDGGKGGEGQPTGPEVKVDPATGGTISGTVKFEGAAPTERVNSVEADPYCLSKHPDGVKSETAMVGAGGELGNVFVWVKKGIKGRYAPPAGAVSLRQEGCRYVPHVLGIQTGQDLLIHNDDETMHNVHSLPKINGDFNFAQTKKGDEAKKKFSAQEVMVKFKCDAHGWMSAYVGVVNHPFFAVTGADGKFELKYVPPGEYEIEAWHEKFGSQVLPAKIDAKGTATLGFTFKEK